MLESSLVVLKWIGIVILFIPICVLVSASIEKIFRIKEEGALFAAGVITTLMFIGFRYLVFGGYVEIHGYVQPTNQGEHAQVVIAFIEGKEVGRTAVVFHNSPQYRFRRPFRLEFRARPSEWPKRTHDVGELTTDKETTLKSPFKDLVLRTYTNLPTEFAASPLTIPAPLNEDSSYDSKPSPPQIQTAMIPTLIVWLVSIGSGFLSYSFLSHFVPKILPQDEKSGASRVISVAVAGIFSVMFMLWLATSDQSKELVSRINGGMFQTVSTAISIIFIFIGAFLFWKKIKAYLS